MIQLQIQADTQDMALDLIRSAISAEVHRLELGFRTTEKHIQQLESKYNVTSDVFLRDFAAEDMTHGDTEYVIWAGELNLRKRIVAQLETLKGIQYAAQ